MRQRIIATAGVAPILPTAYTVRLADLKGS